MVSAQAITGVILLDVELMGYSQLLGQKHLLVVLHDVSDGKQLGICQTVEQAARGDTGEAVNLVEDCVQGCVSFPCLMFGIAEEKGGELHRYFTPHPPEY